MASKIEIIRNAVLSADKIEADQLITYISNGRIMTTDFSLIYQAEAEVIVLEWMGAIHKIAWALGKYLRDHEPNQPEDALEYEVDIIDHPKCDVRFTLPYTERVVIDADDNTVETEACTKPIPDPAQWSILNASGTGD